MRPQSTNKTQRGDRLFNLDLFYAYVDRSGPQDCHTWRGSLNNAGYGLMGFNWVQQPPGTRKGNMMSAHRAAWIIANDQEIPPGMNVNHTCHCRTCVNPDHLEIGTQTEKIAKMLADQVRFGGGVAGRSTGLRYKKDANRNYKWSEDEITWFRNAPTSAIAARLGFSLARASSFRTRMRNAYRWLPWTGKKYARCV